jgi:regulator of RNase E activity RraB
MNDMRRLAALFILGFLAGCSREASDPDDVPDSVVVENLRDAGSDVSKPHAIDFNLYVPDESDATKLEQQLRAQGFEVTIDQGDDDWGVTATKKMVPDPDEITKVGDSLRKLAEAAGGEYDGWGAAVVP